MTSPSSPQQTQWEQRCELFLAQLHEPASHAAMEAEKMKALTLLGWTPQPQPQKKQTPHGDEVWMLSATFPQQKAAAKALQATFESLHDDELRALQAAQLSLEDIAPNWEPRRLQAQQALQIARDQGLPLTDLLRICLGSACQVSELAFWSLGWRVQSHPNDSVVDFFSWRLGNLTRPLLPAVGRQVQLRALACWDAVDTLSFHAWGSERWPSFEEVDGHCCALDLFAQCQREDWSVIAPPTGYSAAEQTAWTIDANVFDALWNNPWIQRSAQKDSPWRERFALIALAKLASQRNPASAAWKEKMRWGVAHGLEISTRSPRGDNLLHVLLEPTSETGSEGYYIDPPPDDILWIVREWPTVDWNAKDQRGFTPIDFALRVLPTHRLEEAVSIQNILLASQEALVLHTSLTPVADGSISPHVSPATKRGNKRGKKPSADALAAEALPRPRRL